MQARIPRTFNRGRTYWSKKHIDSDFAKKAPDASITEWYSVAELQEKFGMTLSAIYTFVYKIVIPKRKEGKMVYYSKKHFDIAKGIATPEEPQYYNTISPATSSITMWSITTSLALMLANIPRFCARNSTSSLSHRRLSKVTWWWLTPPSEHQFNLQQKNIND